MQIHFHIGAHETDGGQLVRSLLRNRADLAEAGIVVPGPGRYKDLIREVSTELRGRPASAETALMVLEAITEDERAERLVLSNENFLCRPTVALGRDCLYPKAHKAAWLDALFPGHEVEFSLAIRHPAAFVAGMLRRLDKTGQSWGQRLADLDPADLSWADMVDRLVEAAPGRRLLVWTYEEAPLIWGDILVELAGIEDDLALDGTADRQGEVLSIEAAARLDDLLAARGDIGLVERRRVVAGFVDAFGAWEASEALNHPVWTDDILARFTEVYEADIAEIAAMPDVTFLSL